MKTEKVVPIKLEPVRSYEFQLAEHRYQRHDCIVPAGTTNEDLENPDLWVNVASRMRMLDEVRVIADDHSFVAYMIVLFSQGHDARLKLISGTDLGDEVDVKLPQGKFNYKLAGTKKYIVYNVKTGEELKSGLPTKLEAIKWLDDYERALRS